MSIFHRHRLPTTERGRVLGRISPTQPTKLKYLHDCLTSPLPAPGDEIPTPAVAWQIDGNQAYGDCTNVAAANAEATWDQLLTSTGYTATLPAVPTSAEVIAQYCALTGCKKPGDSHDTGMVIETLLHDWQTTGLWPGREKIAAYAPVDIGPSTPLVDTPVNQTAIRQAIDAYGLVDVGVNLPQSAEDQFDAGEPWTYVGDEPIGGHDILFVAYTGRWLVGVTWGSTVLVGPEWWQVYGEEAWCLIPSQYVTAGRGQSLDLATLRADIAAA